MDLYFNWKENESTGRNENIAIAEALINSTLKPRDLEEIAKHLLVYTDRYKTRYADARMVHTEEDK